MKKVSLLALGMSLLAACHTAPSVGISTEQRMGVEAIAMAVGSNQVSMVTVLQWTSSGWASLTNGTGGSGTIVTNPTTVTPFITHTVTEISRRIQEVNVQLTRNLDPIGGLIIPPGNMAPDAAGDATLTHDYTVNKSGKVSTFFWVPTFVAYQRINPASFGGTNTSKPVGYWVKGRPGVGAQDVSWAMETCGGLYAGKYTRHCMAGVETLPSPAASGRSASTACAPTPARPSASALPCVTKG